MSDANATTSEAIHPAAVSPQRVADSDQAEARKRPKPGERKIQILQALASMLEQPGGERVTTAALAARLNVSEAALYRHFASKAQMFERLIEFIEQTVFLLINQIVDREQTSDSHSTGVGVRQCAKVITMLAQFAEKNPGMARVMVGDALVFENERLQQRMNQFFDKIEATLKQCLRDGVAPEPATQGVQADPQVHAAVLVAFAAGRLQRFVRSRFKRLPTERLDASLALLLG
jgi:TetR/AcrR family transcriptional regulator